MSALFSDERLVVPRSPAHASTKPWHAIGSRMGSLRHVFFLELGGEYALAVLADRILTVFDSTGSPREVRRLPHEAIGVPRSVGGAKVLLASGALLDLDTWDLRMPGTDFDPSCLSPSGTRAAGSGRDGELELLDLAPQRPFPPPIRRGSRALAVTDAGDIIFHERDSERLLRYDYAKDASVELCRRPLRRARYVVAANGSAAVVLGETSIQVLAIGAWQHGRALRMRSTGIAFGSGGDIVIAGDRTLVLLRPDGSERFATVRPCTSLARPCRSLAVSPDGTKVAVGTDDARVELLDGEGWSNRRPSARSVEPSADSGHVLDGPGPVHVTIRATEIRWSGALTGTALLEAPRPRSPANAWYAVWDGALAPDGKRIALWQAPHPKENVSAPPDGVPPPVVLIDLVTGEMLQLPLHGPLAFDGDAVVGCIHDPVARTLNVARIGRGEAVELVGSLGWSRPLRLAASGGAWAFAMASGETVLGGPTPDLAPRRVVHRSPSLANPHASLPSPADAVFVELPHVVVVRGGERGLRFDGALVEVLDHASGVVVGRHELPHPSSKYSYSEGLLSFLHQDGEMEQLDVRTGVRCRPRPCE